MIGKYEQAVFYMNKWKYPTDSYITNVIYIKVKQTFAVFCNNKLYYGFRSGYFYIGNVMCQDNKDYRILAISLNNREKSYMLTGFNRKHRIKYYKDLKRNCKFKTIVDIYHKWSESQHVI